MNPQCKITIDGQLASGVFMDRLISCEVTDKDGTTSDSVSIELNDYPPAAIPRKGAKIRVWMGHGGDLAFMGAFTVDEVTVTALPYTMSISGKGADFKGAAKAQKSRHWDETTLQTVISDIAGDLGLNAKVDSAIGSFEYPWIGQQTESPLEFLDRLAKRHNALFSIKDGNLVFSEKGTGKNAAGAALTPITVTREMLVEGSTKINFADRSDVKSVKASWYDKLEARLKIVEEAVDE